MDFNSIKSSVYQNNTDDKIKHNEPKGWEELRATTCKALIKKIIKLNT